jgi:hypothetical protein
MSFDEAAKGLGLTTAGSSLARRESHRPPTDKVPAFTATRSVNAGDLQRSWSAAELTRSRRRRRAAAE